MPTITTITTGGQTGSYQYFAIQGRGGDGGTGEGWNAGGGAGGGGGGAAVFLINLDDPRISGGEALKFEFHPGKS